jgi:hypothetical protein
MGKNSLPPAVLQTIENLNDKSTPEHIRFNYLRSLENIRECCDAAIKEYERKHQPKAKVKM